MALNKTSPHAYVVFIRRFLTFLLLLWSFLFACAGIADSVSIAEQNPPQTLQDIPPTTLPIRLTDDRGRSVQLKHSAKRIISLSPSLRSEEHTSELQSQFHLVCRLLLEKKNKQHNN